MAGNIPIEKDFASIGLNHSEVIVEVVDNEAFHVNKDLTFATSENKTQNKRYFK